MKSVKPGRTGSLISAVAGLVMLFIVLERRKYLIDPYGERGVDSFTIFFIIALIIGIGISLYTAFAKNRMSVYDITDSSEEKDPLNRIGNSDKTDSSDGNFCPYCGSETEEDHSFCKKCGKPLK